jgi:hypothetical protein
MRSKSEVVGTRRSVAHFLESIKNQASILDLMVGRGGHATWQALTAEGMGFAISSGCASWR